MVFQNYALYPTMTAYENIAFPLQNAHYKKKDIDSSVKSIAVELGIDDLLERKPAEMSGGQQQRVAIARALVRKPSLLLMDEPLSNLDSALRNQLRFEIKKLHKSIGATIVYVTHDQAEALTLASRIILLSNGMIQQIGTPHTLSLYLYRKVFTYLADYGYSSAIGISIMLLNALFSLLIIKIRKK